jgi:hypothetical protein
MRLVESMATPLRARVHLAVAKLSQMGLRH